MIVSDGSTDGTDEIVQPIRAEHPWIELVRMPERQERHFAGKVNAFNAGYARVAGLPTTSSPTWTATSRSTADYFDVPAAEVRRGPTARRGRDPVPGRARSVRLSLHEHRARVGACQLFRRECFEEIGGYIP